MKPSIKVASVVLAIIIIMAIAGLFTLMQPGKAPTPISSKPFQGETFVRYAESSLSGEEVKPLSGFALQQIVHPYMGFEGGGLHGNAYNSDVHVAAGPAGNNLQVKTRSVSPFPGGLCPTITFDKQGYIVAMCASFLGFEINLFEPHTLNLLATYKLPTRPSTFEAAVKLNIDIIFLDTSGGSYFYLDDKDRAVLADADQQILRLAHRQTENGEWEFYTTDSWNMKPLAPHDCLDMNNWFPEGECDPITSVMPDYQGRIWWVTRHGRVGTVNTESGNMQVHHFAGEEIQNSLSADAQGMYVITDYALYHMVADANDKPQVVWKERYPRSNAYRYGNINNGSGSTPTLLDDERGRKYVVITDAGDDRTGLVVYRRELAVDGERQICRVPLFQNDASAVEISPVGWGRTIVVKNDAGYRSAFHGTSEASIAGGIMRIDIRADDSGCDVIWQSAERVPAVVGKLSSNGMLYYYSFEEQQDGENAWYFLAINYETGKNIYKQFIGAGQHYDINWGSPAIASDGTVYLGILEGIIAISDKQAYDAGE